MRIENCGKVGNLRLTPREAQLLLSHHNNNSSNSKHSSNSNHMLHVIEVAVATAMLLQSH